MNHIFSGTERHLVSFTVRDSEVAFVNLTCWGGEQYVKMIACELHISDVGKEKNTILISHKFIACSRE